MNVNGIKIDQVCQIDYLCQIKSWISYLYTNAVQQFMTHTADYGTSAM